MSSTKDIDRGWNSIFRELKKAGRMEVAVGILQGSGHGYGEGGVPIAEYATYNEFGTGNIPSRPFMATSFDENLSEINDDFKRQSDAIVKGERTTRQALTIIGQKHASRVQNTIANRDFLPKLAPSTIAAKKGSSKTLVDTGAMLNSVQISVRNRTP
jgi:hypothetical protein